MIESANVDKTQTALANIKRIQMDLRLNRHGTVIHRATLSPDDLMIRQILREEVKLLESTGLLMDAVEVLQDQFDPFSEEFQRATKAIETVQQAIEKVQESWKHVPMRLIGGLHIGDDNMASHEMGRSES